MNKMSSKIKAIIFDMDGVLIDSMPAHIEAWDKTWKKYNIAVSQNKIKSLCGLSSKETIEKICSGTAHSCSDEFIKKVIKDKSALKTKGKADVVFKIIPEILDIIKKKNYLMAIVSGSPRKNVTEMNKKYFSKYMQALVSADDTEKGKPNPAPFSLSLTQLQKIDSKLKAENCLVIEDGIMGLMGAREAGMKTLGLATTVSPSKLEPYSDFIFDNHKELLCWLMEK